MSAFDLRLGALYAETVVVQLQLKCRLFSSRRVSTQPEERKNGHNDDNQSDQINNIVHTSLPSTPACVCMSDKQTGGTRDCSIKVVRLRKRLANELGAPTI
jgi:hypothetical protein